jgi:DNA-binding transcriptional MerR regulator
MEKIFSTGEVAKILGIARHKIEYAIANSHLPEVQFRFLDKRCFTNDDVKRIGIYFGVQADAALLEQIA